MAELIPLGISAMLVIAALAIVLDIVWHEDDEYPRLPE